MDIIELLKRQHEEVSDTLERMIAEDDARETRALLGRVSKALRLHMAIEERLVYPAADRAFTGDEDDEETVVQAYEEHAIVRRCLETLEGTAPSDKRFIVRAKILKDLLEKHIDEEESELLPELAGKLGRDGIQKLGDQVERRMSEVATEAMRARAGEPAKSAAERPARARAGQTARGAASARAASAPRRGRGATGGGARARTRSRATGGSTGSRKSSSGARRSGARPSSSGESNGNKPRRGESTSRS